MLTDTPLRDGTLTTSGTETPDAAALFTSSVARIEEAYTRLGHRIGWRFLTSPRRTLAPTTRIAFVTLNPGGDHEPADHPRASSEAGSAYVVEQWAGHVRGGAPLQRQVQMLFSRIQNATGRPGPLADFLSNEVLSAHFVPFRSPRFADLAQRAESLRFAEDLWSDLLKAWQPNLLLTIDTEAYSRLGQVLVRSVGARKLDGARMNTGWGAYQAEWQRYDLPGRTRRLTLARLPHLSTFKLFSRPACRPHMDQFVDSITQDL
jgi:hypothetical protein